MVDELPESPDSHANDTRAYLNLRQVFPIHWKIIKPVDLLSSIEYGEDWIVQITKDADSKRFATPIEFGIQSKVVSKIKGRRIGVRMKRKTLNRLYSAARPIILHVYHPATDTSYWLWLDRYIAENLEKWGDKKKIIISVPLANVLDEKAVDEIEAYVRHFHKPHEHLKKLQIASDLDPNFGYEIQSNGFSVYQKHPEAILQFFVVPANASEAQEQMKNAIEIGVPAEFTGQIHFENMQSYPASLIGDKDALIRIFPLVPDASFPARIRFIDGQDSELISIPFVSMKLTRDGTIEKEWLGLSNGMQYRLIHNFENDESNFNISLEQNLRNPIKIRRFYNLLDFVPKANTVAIENLETLVTGTINIGSALVVYSPPDMRIRHLVDALATIATYLEVSIPVPDSFTELDVINADEAVKILKTGRSSTVPGLVSLPEDYKLIGGTSVKEARQILEIFDEGGQITLHAPGTSQSNIEVLGMTLELGPTRYIFPNSRLLEVDELRASLAHFGGDAVVQIIADYDRTALYAEFLDWSKGQPTDSEL